jgi:hypothetical protein
MVSYCYSKSGDRGFGTQYIESELFPSVRRVGEIVGSNIVILSVFEFKNNQDFEDAQR